MGKKWGWKKRENIVVKHYLLCVYIHECTGIIYLAREELSINTCVSSVNHNAIKIYRFRSRIC